MERSPWVAAVLRNYVPEKHLGMLVDLLAPEPTRRDGLPAFSCEGLKELPPSDLALKPYGAGTTLRALIAAVKQDLEGWGPLEVADKLGVGSRFSDDDRRRSVYRYVNKRGRPLLAELGAWPWACFSECATGKRPPPQWWTSPEALAPLTHWHFEAWRLLWLETRRSCGGHFGPATAEEAAEALAEWEAATERVDGGAELVAWQDRRDGFARAAWRPLGGRGSPRGADASGQ